MSLLAPNLSGSPPALCELRGFFTDAKGSLYVVNAYNEFSNILIFSSPAAFASPYSFASLFAASPADGLAHPFYAVLAADGHVYVSNQDILGQAKSSTITFYEESGMAHPGRYEGVFADPFITSPRPRHQRHVLVRRRRWRFHQQIRSQDL